jgi:hypothetical protein
VEKGRKHEKSGKGDGKERGGEEEDFLVILFIYLFIEILENLKS